MKVTAILLMKAVPAAAGAEVDPVVLANASDDPRKKANSKSRDWLNNMVGDLESQIDSFKAEMEDPSVKKGKTRPPWLTHLEDSISCHKQHITKLELILQLLENDGLSPEEVNEVKEYIEDYVERNQDNFEEFGDVEDLYQSLPLDKLEALEAKEAIPIVASSIVVEEKDAVAAASGTPSTNGTSLKSPVSTPVGQTVKTLLKLYPIIAYRNLAIQCLIEDAVHNFGDANDAQFVKLYRIFMVQLQVCLDYWNVVVCVLFQSETNMEALSTYER